VEVLNEPPLVGLPNICRILSSRRNIFDFHAAVLDALDQCSPPIRTPIAIQDGHGSLAGASAVTAVTASIPVSRHARELLSAWGKRNQLILSFHYYPGGALSATSMKYRPFLQKARKQSAELMGDAPLWLSEFWAMTAQEIADMMAEAADSGVNATTYWQFADDTYTGHPGWYRYPPSVLKYGDPISDRGEVNWPAWQAFQETVHEGTFWGGLICGAAGGQSNVLELVPVKAPETAGEGAMHHTTRPNKSGEAGGLESVPAKVPETAG